MSWGLYGIINTQMGNVKAPITLNDGSQQPIDQFLSDALGYDYGFRWPVIGIILAFTIAFLVGGIACLRLLNYQVR